MNISKHSSSWIRPCSTILAIMLALTALNYALGKTGMSGTHIMLVVLSTAAIKVLLVSEFFMGLRHTNPLWRLLMLGWLLLVLGLICVAYLSPVN